MSVPQIFPSVTTLGIISYFGVGVKCFFLTDVYSIISLWLIKQLAELGNYFCMFHFVLNHDILIMLSHQYPATGGGVVCMENIAISFLISCLASIAAYYVCKWLDGDK